MQGNFFIYNNLNKFIRPNFSEKEHLYPDLNSFKLNES